MGIPTRSSRMRRKPGSRPSLKSRAVIAVDVTAPLIQIVESPLPDQDANAEKVTIRCARKVAVFGRVRNETTEAPSGWVMLGKGFLGLLGNIELDLSDALPMPTIDDATKGPKQNVRLFVELAVAIPSDRKMGAKVVPEEIFQTRVHEVVLEPRSVTPILDSDAKPKTTTPPSESKPAPPPKSQ